MVNFWAAQEDRVQRTHCSFTLGPMEMELPKLSVEDGGNTVSVLKATGRRGYHESEISHGTQADGGGICAGSKRGGVGRLARLFDASTVRFPWRSMLSQQIRSFCRSCTRRFEN